jgi:hypothetical protein
MGARQANEALQWDAFPIHGATKRESAERLGCDTSVRYCSN